MPGTIGESRPTGGSTIRRPKPVSSEPDRNLLELTRASLEDDKAEDIVVIELAGKSTIADFMVIATGRSTRQSPPWPRTCASS